MTARRALLISCGEYDDPQLPLLRSAAGDASELAAVLSDPAIGAFSDVLTLPDGDARTIKMEAIRFLRAAALADTLVLYFTGHGLVRDDRFYLCCKDTATEFPEATAIEGTWLNDAMADSYAGTIMLLLDCCFSGAFVRGFQTKGPVNLDPGTQFDVTQLDTGGRGRFVLSASSALSPAFEDSRRSIFTAAIVDGLVSGEADINKDGLVSIEDLRQHLDQTVPQRLEQQRPRFASNSTGVVNLAFNPKLGQFRKLLYHSSREPNAFDWPRYLTRPYDRSPITRSHSQGHPPALRIATSGAEAIGVNRAFKVTAGIVQFEYQVDGDPGEGERVYLAVIPMTTSGELQLADEGPKGKLRALFVMPLETYGAAEWHQGLVNFDFSHLAHVTGILIAPRINELCVERAKAVLTLRNVQLYG